MGHRRVGATEQSGWIRGCCCRARYSIDAHHKDHPAFAGIDIEEEDFGVLATEILMATAHTGRERSSANKWTEDRHRAQHPQGSYRQGLSRRRHRGFIGDLLGDGMGACLTGHAADRGWSCVRARTAGYRGGGKR